MYDNEANSCTNATDNQALTVSNTLSLLFWEIDIETISQRGGSFAASGAPFHHFGHNLLFDFLIYHHSRAGREPSS